ncbi:MAG TPA: L-2-hydroxyglutarate oxidase [Acidimicrobiia bacterium]|nr:L-2-hydroxyglutarate oxidase [Acidimicrobiia bacterium]
MERVDVLVVGGGIVGLATARAVIRAHPGRSVAVVEKEASVGTHQSGRNSGVIHAGVYYAPGSEKARLCVAGRTSMVEYCREHGIEHAVCGKVVVAEDDDDQVRLKELERRCGINGVRTEMIGPERLREIEPHVAGAGALHVLEAGVVDYVHVCRALAAEISASGATIRLGCSVVSGAEDASGLVVETTLGPIEAQRVVTCAGLHADEVAKAVSGPDGAGDLRVIAFRGEYRELAPTRSHLVRTLVYPVPDPQFPFLGVHLTRGVDGVVHVGPNAVLALAREGYSWRRVDVRHLRATFGFSGFRRFARANWRFGIDEMVRSVSARRFAAAVRRLVPEIERADLTPARAGVRAQAIGADGSLVDDFAIRSVGRALHVLNAPSPAATASLEIGASIAARLDLGSV